MKVRLCVRPVPAGFHGEDARGESRCTGWAPSLLAAGCCGAVSDVNGMTSDLSRSFRVQQARC